MTGPLFDRERFDEFDTEQIDDDLIERLLVSDDPSDRRLGMILLDFEKSKKFVLYLRRRSIDRNWQLTTTEIEFLWETTLGAIEHNIERGIYERRGKLDGYIWMICFFRAISYLRKRPPINDKIDVELAGNRVSDDSEPIDPIDNEQMQPTLEEQVATLVLGKLVGDTDKEVSVEEIASELEDVLGKGVLSDKQLDCLAVTVMLFAQNGEPPSLDLLDEVINKDRQDGDKGKRKQNLSAVNSRARKRLQNAERSGERGDTSPEQGDKK